MRFGRILYQHHLHRAIGPANGGRQFLLESLMHAARAMGARDMTLEVRVSNAVAQRMYQNHGFTSVGLRKKYYSDNGEDAYIMWCRLEDGPREENPV